MNSRVLGAGVGVLILLAGLGWWALQPAESEPEVSAATPPAPEAPATPAPPAVGGSAPVVPDAPVVSDADVVEGLRAVATALELRVVQCRLPDFARELDKMFGHSEVSDDGVLTALVDRPRGTVTLERLGDPSWAPAVLMWTGAELEAVTSCRVETAWDVNVTVRVLDFDGDPWPGVRVQPCLEDVWTQTDAAGEARVVVPVNTACGAMVEAQLPGWDAEVNVATVDGIQSFFRVWGPVDAPEMLWTVQTRPHEPGPRADEIDWKPDRAGEGILYDVLMGDGFPRVRYDEARELDVPMSAGARAWLDHQVALEAHRDWEKGALSREIDALIEKYPPEGNGEEAPP